MKSTHDLSQLDWRLTGWLPFLWRLGQPGEVSTSQSAEVFAVPAKVPGSVQKALLDAGVIADWNYGLNYRDCQWVENLHWIYEAKLPDDWIEEGRSFRLECLGLDGPGWLRVNGEVLAEFDGSHLPHVFDLTSHLKSSDNVLQIVFGCPPRWQGQFGFTSQFTEWKVRFNYTWDWTARLVQIGIWEPMSLVATDGAEISEFRATTFVDNAGTASLRAWGRAGGEDKVRLTLSDENGAVWETELPVEQFNAEGANVTGLDVERWWPNLHGDQPFYTLQCELISGNWTVVEEQARRVGFRHIEWRPCEGAPPEADPWICAVNGKPIFLQGANWAPIRPNFADVTVQDYRQRLELYKELGFNILRVWGGGVLERECFYDLCDELGLMVWQEFPMSSSGCENCPPEDPEFMRQMVPVVESYIKRRQHHPSLIIWSGGNELRAKDNLAPVDDTHPMIRLIKDIVEREDPSRRFLTSSPTGPKFHVTEENIGKGLHWNVHGPWLPHENLDDWQAYWDKDDALFHAETGSPGTSSAEIIRKYAGDCKVEPYTVANPYWRRPVNWWIEYDKLVRLNGREPRDLEEYVEWSQERQAKALTIAIKACKDRFPGCGGFIIWMGHDCFPCTANTSVIDFEGKPKAAALAVAEIFKS